MGEHYLKYRRRALQRQLSNTSYMDYRRITQDIGRQFGQSQQDSMNLLKRQGVPLAQRIAAQQQSLQQFTSQMGQQFRDLRQQETQRQEALSTQIAETDAQLEEIKQQKEDAWKQTLFQIGGTAVGAGVGLLAGNPLMGAQIGAGVGQAAAGASTEEWDMALAGVGQTIAGISEAAGLKSIRDNATAVGQKLAEIREAVEKGEIDSATAAMYGQQLSDILQGGGDVRALLDEFDIYGNKDDTEKPRANSEPSLPIPGYPWLR